MFAILLILFGINLVIDQCLNLTVCYRYLIELIRGASVT